MDSKLQAELSRLSKGALLSIIADLAARLGNDIIPFISEKVEQLKTCWAFELPQQYFCVILTQWLSLQDVAHLDNAVCNGKLRPRYLSCYSKGYVVFPNCPSKWTLNHEVMLTWLVSRQVKLRDIVVSQLLQHMELFGMFLRASGRSLYCVRLTGTQHVSSDVLLALINYCPNLRELHFDKCSYHQKTNTMETILSSFAALKVLNISETVGRTQLVTTESGGNNTWNFPAYLWTNTEHLNIVSTQLEEFLADGHTDLSDEIVLNVFRTCNRLRVVSLNNCSGITAIAFQQLAPLCPHLTELRANHTQIDDAALVAIAQHCRAFRVLVLNGFLNVSDVGVLAVIDSCPELRMLELDRNFRITDEVLLRVYPSCPHIQTLSVSACTSLSVSAVMNIIKLCPELQTFRILDFSPEFDTAVRTELYNGKYWLGNWKHRKLTIVQTSKV